MAKYCRLCEMHTEAFDTLCETKFFYSKLDRCPITPGHSIVVPKRHLVSVFDLKKDEWEDLMAATKKTIKMVNSRNLRLEYAEFMANPTTKESKAYCKRILKHMGISKAPDGYNLGINEGRAAGRTIDHMHLHIIPRYLGDVSTPDGGIRHMLKSAKL